MGSGLTGRRGEPQPRRHRRPVHDREAVRRTPTGRAARRCSSPTCSMPTSPRTCSRPRALSEAVLVATPSATIGLEFDTVVVAGLQEGVWPNMRLRGSLLGAARAGARGARHRLRRDRRAPRHPRRRAAAVRAGGVTRPAPPRARGRRQRRRGGQPVPDDARRSRRTVPIRSRGRR